MKKEHSCEYVKRWRLKTRQRIAEAFGGKCGLCPYSKCLRALELHHLDPGDKEFTFGNILAHAISWEKMVVELRKCVLLCANCHREVHDGLVLIPQNIRRFDEDFVEYRDDGMDECPVCHGPKKKCQMTCSYKCAATRANKIKWPDDLPELVIKSSKRAVAIQLGVSDKAVAKRLKNHYADSSIGRAVVSKATG